MTPVTETVVNGGPFASSNRAERKASPFRGSRNEAAEDAGSFEAAATSRNRKISEENAKRKASLIEENGSLKARIEAQAAASRLEIDGLKMRITQLQTQNSRLEGTLAENLGLKVTNSQLQAQVQARAQADAQAKAQVDAQAKARARIVAEIQANPNEFMKKFWGRR